MLFVGDDWSEDRHDVEIQDESGRRLGRGRLAEGIAGIARLHELIAQQLGEDDGPEQVVVGIETDRGPWVVALIAAGYQGVLVASKRFWSDMPVSCGDAVTAARL